MSREILLGKGLGMGNRSLEQLEVEEEDVRRAVAFLTAFTTNLDWPRWRLWGTAPPARNTLEHFQGLPPPNPQGAWATQLNVLPPGSLMGHSCPPHLRRLGLCRRSGTRKLAAYLGSCHHIANIHLFPTPIRHKWNPGTQGTALEHFNG